MLDRYLLKSFAALLFWVILMMVLGFWAGTLYTLIALQTCGMIGSASGTENDTISVPD
jgi:hypothetical protein